MKTLIAVLALTLLLSNCRSNGPFSSNYLGSATTIPAGRIFELGGNSNGAFSAQVQNAGSCTVLISQRQSDGRVTVLGQLEPGKQRVLEFATGATALFANASSRSAEIGLKVIGDTNLRMGYAKENQ